VYEAFFAEQREINRLCELIDRPSLFKDVLDDDRRPLEFAPMLLPTQRQLYAFAQTLDKLLSENVNRDFFRDDIPMEDRIEAKDGSIERRSVFPSPFIVPDQCRIVGDDAASARTSSPRVAMGRHAPMTLTTLSDRR